MCLQHSWALLINLKYMNYIIKKKHFTVDSSRCAFWHFPLTQALLPFSGWTPEWLLFNGSFMAREGRRGRGCCAGQWAQGTVRVSPVPITSSPCSMALQRIGYAGAEGHPWGLPRNNMKTQGFFLLILPKSFRDGVLALQQAKVSLHPCARSLLFN